MTQSERPLEGRITLVAGATRGAGRGIARMLGEAGAVVYCTGRSARGAPAEGTPHAGRPETIDETAELVTAAGGTGVAVQVDHADPTAVRGLAQRVRRDHGRLDVLVNVLGGAQVEDAGPFWRQNHEAGRALFDGWLWPHVLTCRTLVPLMVERRRGLVVEVVEGDGLDAGASLYFDLAVTALKRLAWRMAEELAEHGVTALAVAPGFMRTEVVLAHLDATEATWPQVAESSAAARGFGFAGSESPCFVGRAVAALAADPAVHRRAGTVCSSWELSEAYGFTDVDGRRPHWGRYGKEHFPQFFDAPPKCGHRWTVVPVAGRDVAPAGGSAAG